MPMKMTKDQGLTISASTIVSIVGSLGAVWAFAAPIAQKALAGEIETQLEQKLKPIRDSQAAQQAANIITTSSTVRNLQNSITALEFKRDTCAPKPDCWTVRDAQDLQGAKSDLIAAEAALRALRQ